MLKNSFLDITELPRGKASRDQLQRLVNRYHFAANLCLDKDVLEVACGPGMGLGLLKARARSLVAGDLDEQLLAIAKKNYPDDLDLRLMDAHELPFEENSLDIVILFEAIYYLRDPAEFAREVKRVLRPHGKVIVCNPNKDLPDFHPSALSKHYFNPKDFRFLFEPLGFAVTCYGDSPIVESIQARLISSVKRWASRLHLIPETLNHRAFIKRLIYGELVALPANLVEVHLSPQPLTTITTEAPDSSHRVIFCVAKSLVDPSTELKAGLARSLIADD